MFFRIISSNRYNSVYYCWRFLSEGTLICKRYTDSAIFLATIGKLIPFLFT